MNEGVDYSKLDPIKECPLCDGELDKAVVNAPRGLYWDEKARGSSAVRERVCWIKIMKLRFFPTPQR